MENVFIKDLKTQWYYITVILLINFNHALRRFSNPGVFVIVEVRGNFLNTILG